VGRLRPKFQTEHKIMHKDKILFQIFTEKVIIYSSALTAVQNI